MSYDLTAFRPLDGEDPETWLNRQNEDYENDSDPGPTVERVEVEKRSLAAALIQSRPSLVPFEFNFLELAASEAITESEARRKWRHIELNENGPLKFQIILYDDSASIYVPYWHAGEDARKTFTALWRCLELLADHAGYCVYDHQIGRVLNLQEDLEVVLRRYRGTMAVMPQIIRPRPWWKFWQ